MGLLDRIAAERIRTRDVGRKARGRKSFTEPPFWSLDPFRSAFVSSLPDQEQVENDFEGYVEAAFKASGPVFSCMVARQMVFSEARFQWRRIVNGRPQDLFGSPELAILEHPWPSGTTGELLAHAIQDVDLAGNAFFTVTDDNGRFGRAAAGPGRRAVRMRPDWMTIIIVSRSGDPWAIDNRVGGFLYRPRMNGTNRDGTAAVTETLLMPDQVAHFSPIPDPVARYRGMSWLTPVLRDIGADKASTRHKDRFFANGANPSMVVKFDKEVSEDAFDEFVETFKATHQGAENAYKTLFLMGGADVTPLTMDFRQLEFSQTVGKGESRIASAAGVPPSWVGFSEGLQGSSLNQGNFSAARRRFADGTVRPLWRGVSASLQTLVTPPDDGATLWYDDRDIAFLREDEQDQAEVVRTEMNAIDAGVKAGFGPDDVVRAVANRDVTQLIGSHTGLVSVQMQPPMAASEPTSGEPPATSEEED
ncbi:phage portal protein [Nocardiopsis sp. NPDC049922]|uniref:phage portal protein n=1 Tax=Nocardiopsis sp. NPDC049922 TaxID=3155157 RepID=UPI0034071569